MAEPVVEFESASVPLAMLLATTPTVVIVVVAIMVTATAMATTLANGEDSFVRPWAGQWPASRTNGV